jgi:hypothetical protein
MLCAATILASLVREQYMARACVKENLQVLGWFTYCYVPNIKAGIMVL